MCDASQQQSHTAASSPQQVSRNQPAATEKTYSSFFCFFSNDNMSVFYVPVAKRDPDPDWAQRRHAIDPSRQESQLPLKAWQWNCTPSIGSTSVLFMEESSIHHSLMSDNWWQVGPGFPALTPTSSQSDGLHLTQLWLISSNYGVHASAAQCMMGERGSSLEEDQTMERQSHGRSRLDVLLVCSRKLWRAAAA